MFRTVKGENIMVNLFAIHYHKNKILYMSIADMLKTLMFILLTV